MQSSRSFPTRRIPDGSNQAIRRAEDYVRAHAGTTILVSDLSRAAGVSERTLRRAFQRVRGTSPKRFITAARLGEVRRTLTGIATPSRSVTAAAISHGFCELGRFAAAYRKAFGESPSATLRARRP